MTTDTISIEEFTKNRPTLTFGSFIRSMREIQEIPQIKMAKMMGISKSMLCDIEKGLSKTQKPSKEAKKP